MCNAPMSGGGARRRPLHWLVGRQTPCEVRIRIFPGSTIHSALSGDSALINDSASRSKPQGYAVADALAYWTKYPYARITTRGILSYIGKIQIDFNQDAILFRADSGNLIVLVATKALVQNGQRIVTLVN